MVTGLKQVISESFDESEGELVHNDLYKSVTWYMTISHITICPKEFTRQRSLQDKGVYKTLGEGECG